MNCKSANSTPFPSQLAVILLASAFAIPAMAQQDQPGGTPQSSPPSTAQQQTSPSPSVTTAKEGFWGRVNPWARKKWVKKQTDPINDRLTELDGLNAKNSKDIQDVDSRAQAGIRQAQSAADAANQTATAAGTRAQQAPMPMTARQDDVSGPLAPTGTVQTAFSTPQLKNPQAKRRMT